VRALDHVEPRYGDVPCNSWDWGNDLRFASSISIPTDGMDEVYALAADMGGINYITFNHFDILWNNALINLNTARYCAQSGTPRVLFSSSACVYPERLQDGEGAAGTTGADGLGEWDAWRGKPDTAYGVEKLFSEDIYYHLREYVGAVRIARFHNIFGPRASWNDGREKAPAAICRKIAEAKLRGENEIEVWGDGEQTRSFCYVDDCLEQVYALMHSDYDRPMNIGSDRMVTINELVDIVALIAGVKIEKRHDLTKPQGVRFRNADLTIMRETLGYENRYSLEHGLARAHAWIEAKVKESLA